MANQTQLYNEYPYIGCMNHPNVVVYCCVTNIYKNPTAKEYQKQTWFINLLAMLVPPPNSDKSDISLVFYNSLVS